MRHSPARHRPVPGAVQPVVVTVTREALGRTSSLVLTPAVVAHRGASGHRPEHTLDAYRTAIRMGVDDIELDLVATRDGVLVARHDLELSATTDVAGRPEFAHLLRTLVVDGEEQRGWFVQDFTLHELKTLATRERMPGTRPSNTAYDGAEGVPTLTEVLAMVGAESARRGRPVGLLLELKHATHHDAIGLPLDVPLHARAVAPGPRPPVGAGGPHVVRDPVLRRLAARIPSCAGSRSAPGCRSSSCSTSGTSCGPEALDEIDEYADGIGPHTSQVLPRDRDGAIGAPSTLVRDAHRRGLTVHVWTVRGENRFLPTNLRHGAAPDALGDMAGHVRALLAAGVDGVITDHPEAALAALREL